MNEAVDTRGFCKAIWAHVRAGGRVVLIPAADNASVTSVIASGLPPVFELATGFGSTGFGPDESLLIIFVPPAEQSDLEALTRLLVEEVRSPFLLAMGLEITLFEVVFRNGEVMASVRLPFCTHVQFEDVEAGNLCIEFEAARPATSFTEWFGQLSAAYCEIQGYKHFTFKEPDNGHKC